MDLTERKIDLCPDVCIHTYLPRMSLPVDFFIELNYEIWLVTFEQASNTHMFKYSALNVFNVVTIALPMCGENYFLQW